MRLEWRAAELPRAGDVIEIAGRVGYRLIAVQVLAVAGATSRLMLSATRHMRAPVPAEGCRLHRLDSLPP
ncbi:MAG: hypothetical protein NVS2B11_05440 [Acetobacteraceae bacterium]